MGEARSLYDANREVYGLLRYGVKVKAGVGEQPRTVWLIDWEDPEKNDFAIAEEVTVHGELTKRPDIVLYVNGIALGVLELKRSRRLGEPRASARTSTTRRRTSSSPSSPPCSSSWPATTPRGCATASSRRRRSTTCTWKEENPGGAPAPR